MVVGFGLIDWGVVCENVCMFLYFIIVLFDIDFLLFVLLCLVELCDVQFIVVLICELVEFEKLIYLLQVMFEKLCLYLFGEKLVVEVMVVEVGGEVVVFVLYFINFFIFLVQFGFYFEDFYVQFVYCGKGLGEVLFMCLGKFVVEWGYGCFEWSVFDWNENVICFYQCMGVIVMFDWCICCIVGDLLVVFVVC